MIARLVALLLMLLPGVLQAAGERYVIGVENIDYLPHYAAHTGHFEGFARELLDAFAVAAGIEFEYKPLPVPRMVVSLLRDEVDFLYPDDPSWRTEARGGRAFHYSAPVVSYIDGTLVRPESLGQGDEWVRRLGIVVGFTPCAWHSRLETGTPVLRENAGFAALLNQLHSGRIDAAYANVAVAAEQSRRLFGRADALAFDPGLPLAQGEYRLSTRAHPEVLARFDRWLASEAARVEAIRRAHGLGAVALEAH
ncbi:ABC transporter substrate-binding protein [Marichromatium purpuratum 984]|uniref:ABC transporter substrate-binding protein n=1 Tax=Marichromatium purpuratum 984 TaxID=765910 RepID=W0E5D5_MARPU|nr:transporter substrate-binding domain-containing protein [Marichromatium purpuratum]AHF04261.1 ABC transporter substrate-binding protein [Marichromatium purpuratum 984]